MFDPLEFEKRPLESRLNRLRLVTRLVLVWEALAIAFWRIDCWVLFFAGLWLLQIPDMMGTVGNALALIAFFGGLIVFLRLDLKKFRWPNAHRADRRLEERNALAHRPLETLNDKLANPEQEPTRHLWNAGRVHALALIAKLRPVYAPRPQLAKADPVAFRAAAILMLVTGLVAAGPQWKDRLAYGLFPFSVYWQDRTGENITLWITPPAYTGLAQTTLQGRGDSGDTAPAILAEGSVIKARISNGIGRPSLVMGDQVLKLEKLDGKSWGIEAKAVPADHIAIRQSLMTRASIPVRYVPDMPPEISVSGDPTVLPKGPLQVKLNVKDDYGVNDLVMHMTLDSSVNIADVPAGKAVDDTRAVMSAANAATEITPVYDLTGHPWAGLPAVLTFEARDRAGHVSASVPVHLTLPDRVFFNPVARQLADLRKRLLWTPEMSFPNVVTDVEDLLSRPGDYNGDYVVFLTLSSAASRLSYSSSPREASTPVASLLWDTALRVEDGNLSHAARNLREAREEMEKLLNDPAATTEQVAAAMEKLRQAMAGYFEELYRELQKQMAASGQTLPELPPEAFSKTLDAEDLASFLDQLQADALSGDKDAARQMLSQLQQMTDMMDPSTSMKMPPQIQQMMEGISKVKELVTRQEALLEKTRKLEPVTGTQAEMEEQEKLRHDLGDLMLEAGEKMDQIPENMQKAEQEMRGAVSAFAENKPAPSIPHQEQALTNLKQSQEQMTKQLSAMMQKMTMMSFGVGQTDPLGRPLSEGQGQSMLQNSRIKIPDKSQRKRVQEILNLLRQRSGERSRPDYELDYYHRLMRQF